MDADRDGVFMTASQRFLAAIAELPPVAPWWCDCGSTEGSKGVHDPSCYGEQEAFPRLAAALEASRAARRAR